jgi:hypothetical protein
LIARHFDSFAAS